MKTIDIDGISYIDLIPYGTSEWYFGISYEHGDLYEAEELFRAGQAIEGRNLCLIHYPDGEVYRPVPKQPGIYPAEPVYLDNRIYIPNVDFNREVIQILCFDCAGRETGTVAEMPLDSVKDCYNLQLNIAPLTLTRQSVSENVFEIIWPETIRLEMGSRDSFYLRDGDRLYFSRWNEEGEGRDYRYWDETVIRSLEGEIIEVLPGDVRMMPDGSMWHLR